MSANSETTTSPSTDAKLLDKQSPPPPTYYPPSSTTTTTNVFALSPRQQHFQSPLSPTYPSQALSRPTSGSVIQVHKPTLQPNPEKVKTELVQLTHESFSSQVDGEVRMLLQDLESPPQYRQYPAADETSAAISRIQVEKEYTSIEIVTPSPAEDLEKLRAQKEKLKAQKRIKNKESQKMILRFVLLGCIVSMTCVTIAEITRYYQ